MTKKSPYFTKTQNSASLTSGPTRFVSNAAHKITSGKGSTIRMEEWLLRCLCDLGAVLVLIIVCGSSSAQSPNLPSEQESPEQRIQLEQSAELLETFYRLYGQGEYADAMGPIKESLAIREAVLGANHPETADCVDALARLYDTLGDHQAAELLHQRVLETFEESLGPNHLNTARSLNNYAESLRQQGKFDAAEPLHKRSLKIKENVLGPDHLLTSYSLNNLAALYEDQNNHLAAEPLYKRALKIRELKLGPNHEDTASCLNNLAVLYQSQGKDAAAEPLLERSLKILDERLGIGHPLTLSTTRNLAVAYDVQRKYENAEPLYKRIVEVRERTLGEKHPQTAVALTDLADLYLKKEESAQAKPLYERALRIREAVLGDHRETANSLDNLAYIYKRQADFPAAESLFERALRIRVNTLGKDHGDVAASLNNLSLVYLSQGKYSAAVNLQQRALEISEQLHGPMHPKTARFLSNLAKSLRTQGELEPAVVHLRRALQIGETELGANHLDTATYAGMLAVCYHTQGNYADAAPLMKRALEIREKVLGPKHLDTASSLQALSDLYDDQGNYPNAEPLCRRALRIREEKLGKDHPDVANSLDDLAALLSAQGEFNAAEPLYRRARDINENSLGPNHPSTSMSIHNLAVFYGTQGNLVDAESLFERALKISESRLGSDHPDTATVVRNLGFLRASVKDFDAAETLYRRALKIRMKSLGPHHPSTITIQNDLASLLMNSKNSSAATQLFDQARRGTKFHVSKVLVGLPKSEQLLFLSDKYERDFHKSLSVGFAAMQNQSVVDQSASWLINGKAVAHEALAQKNLLARYVDDVMVSPIVKELIQVREELAGLAMSVTGPEKQLNRRQQFEKLTVDERRLSSKLTRSGNDSQRINDQWIELEQVRSALNDRSVLIDIVRLNLFDFTPNDSHWGLGHYAAWIIHADQSKPTELVDLGLAEDIDILVEAARRSIQNGAKQALSDGEEVASDHAGKELYALAEQIWKPLASRLADVDQIVLSPDGALWLVPWNSLPVGKNSDRFLIEEYALRMIVSGRDLVSQTKDVETRKPVIFADPDFNQLEDHPTDLIRAAVGDGSDKANSDTREFATQSLLPHVNPLPGTAQEAAAIKPNLDELTGKETIVYQQQDASEYAAKLLQRPQIAGFATHGFFLPKKYRKRVDREVFQIKNARSVALSRDGKPVDNPLLRCGLLLSGCNDRRGTVGGNDGILTGLEIVGIDFRGTEMVVLSSCDTGIGDIKSGEGVAGLRQAFQLAGAESVVATLWSVPDRDSALIMNDFFRNLAKGQSRSEALRDAQLKRIASRRKRHGAAHPFFWAAWTLTGQE